jgi:hypothetical protein
MSMAAVTAARGRCRRGLIGLDQERSVRMRAEAVSFGSRSARVAALLTSARHRHLRRGLAGAPGVETIRRRQQCSGCRDRCHRRRWRRCRADAAQLPRRCHEQFTASRHTMWRGGVFCAARARRHRVRATPMTMTLGCGGRADPHQPRPHRRIRRSALQPALHVRPRREQTLQATACPRCQWLPTCR